MPQIKCGSAGISKRYCRTVVEDAMDVGHVADYESIGDRFVDRVFSGTAFALLATAAHELGDEIVHSKLGTRPTSLAGTGHHSADIVESSGRSEGCKLRQHGWQPCERGLWPRSHERTACGAS